MILNKEQIKEIIPYEDPFLFVDEVIEMREKEITGIKQTSPNDYYFKGHFVDFKIMPGVLVIEALAQLSTLLLRKKVGEEHKENHFLAYEVRGVQFLKPIFPGDKIVLKAEILSTFEVNKNEISHIKALASVEDDLKCEARLSIVMVKKEDFKKRYA